MDAMTILLLLVWSIAEMAIIPIPTEFLVIPLVASRGLHPLIVSSIGTLGSAIGAVIDYYLGATAFILLDSKFAINKRVERTKKRFQRIARYGFPGLLIIGRLVPFAVLKPVMIAAGAARYDKRVFIVVIILSSFVRYFVDATVGSLLSLLHV